MKKAIILLIALALICGCKTIDYTSTKKTESAAAITAAADIGRTKTQTRQTHTDSVVTIQTSIDEDLVIIEYSAPDSTGQQYIVKVTQKNRKTGTNTTKKAASVDSLLITASDSLRATKTAISETISRDSTIHHEDADNAIRATRSVSTTIIIIVAVVLLLAIAGVVIYFWKFR